MLQLQQSQNTKQMIVQCPILLQRAINRGPDMLLTGGYREPNTFLFPLFLVFICLLDSLAFGFCPLNPD